jgi:hypothetical protein
MSCRRVPAGAGPPLGRRPGLARQRQQLTQREPAGSASPAGGGAGGGGPAAAAEEAAEQLHALLAGLQAPVDVAVVAQVRRRGSSGQGTLPLRLPQYCFDGIVDIGLDIIL